MKKMQYRLQGEPLIMEPNKCEELIWSNINNLTENTIIAEKRAKYNYFNGISFDEYDSTQKV